MGHHRRRGSLLIIVSGLAAVLLMMSLTFLMRMRVDGKESLLVLQEAQAHLMLQAALNYVQETSRLGWDIPESGADLAASPPFTAGEHEEAFGWNDIRDGSAGPKDRLGRMLYDPAGGRFPAEGGRAARCPMYVMRRPPFATRNVHVYNPVEYVAGSSWSAMISYANHDPQPAVDDEALFIAGDPTPLLESVDLGWFRVYRESELDHDGIDDPGRDDPGYDTPQNRLAGDHAVFILTCGAGGSRGFRDWAEVVADGAQGEFGDDPGLFAAQQREERLLWYRCEWSPANGGNSRNLADDSAAGPPWRRKPINTKAEFNRGFVGSIRWIERLEQEPPRW